MRLAASLACVVALFCAQAFTSTAYGQILTGTMLNNACHSDVGKEFCLGFVMGIWGMPLKHDYNVCLPPEGTGEQMRQVVVKAMEDHPDKLDGPASLIVLGALKGGFPCPK